MMDCPNRHTKETGYTECRATGHDCAVIENDAPEDCFCLKDTRHACPYCAEDYQIKRDERGELAQGWLKIMPGGAYVCDAGHFFRDKDALLMEWEEIGEKLMREALKAYENNEELAHELALAKSRLKKLQERLREKAA